MSDEDDYGTYEGTCECGKQIEYGPCPFSVELRGDYEPCSCCDCKRKICADDI